MHKDAKRQAVTGSGRRQRHAALLRLLESGEFRTQQELGTALALAGHDVTQATLSRDIRELGLVKLGGVYRAVQELPAGESEQAERAVRELVLKFEQAQQLLVLKTRPGHAHALGVELDGAAWPELIGTVAGDDTLLVVAADARRAGRLARRIGKLLGARA